MELHFNLKARRNGFMAVCAEIGWPSSCSIKGESHAVPLYFPVSCLPSCGAADVSDGGASRLT